MSDRWAAGVAYEAYMGRWSRQLAREFLAWLNPKPALHWLEAGCGTGSLTSVVGELGQPASIVACDPSQAFVDHARSHVTDERASFVVAGADSLPTRDGGFDAIVSGLVLNFVPDPDRALASMAERASSGGVVAAYVWNYAGGLEFLQCFWEEAVALDPAAAALDESRRFGSWHPSTLAARFHASGLAQIETGVLEIQTDFSDFDDYWQPFLGGTGPAPSFVASLDATRRAELQSRLEQRLERGNERIRFRARAWAVRGFANR